MAARKPIHSLLGTCHVTLLSIHTQTHAHTTCLTEIGKEAAGVEAGGSKNSA